MTVRRDLGQAFTRVWQLGGSTYKFKVKADDAPFKKGSDTAPRTELATCTDYTEGLHQFAAMVTIPEGTDKVSTA